MTLPQFLAERRIPFSEREDLSRHTSIRCGGICSVFITPHKKEDLVACAEFLSRGGYPWHLVGRMTNTLPPDGMCEDVFLSTCAMQEIRIIGDRAEVAAGVGMAALAKTLLERERFAFAPLAGIPGTLGGAVRGNAGAFGKETADAVISCEIYSLTEGKTLTVPREQMHFSYRRSRLCENPEEILLSVLYAAPHSDRRTVEEEIDRLRAVRRASQPIGEPSLGSVFLRVGDRSAAWYIDRVGGKGLSVGGAKISEKHAGFIVNTGGATAHDVRTLTEEIRRKVLSSYGVFLTPEITIL